MGKKKSTSNGIISDKDKKIVEARVLMNIENLSILRENGYSLHDRKVLSLGEPSFYMVNLDFIMSPNGHPVAAYLSFNGREGELSQVHPYTSEAEKIFGMIQEKKIVPKQVDNLASFLEDRIALALRYEKTHRGLYPV